MRVRWGVALAGCVLSAVALVHPQPARDETDPVRNRLLYGFATMTPGEAPVAGSWGTWTLTLTVGRLGIDEGGQVMLVTRTVSDWGPFQTTSPAADNYATVRTTGQAQLSVRYDNRRAWRRPWYRGLVITVDEGYLRETDQLVVTLGDRSGGSRGARVQTADETDSGLRFVVDAFGTGQAVPVLASPRFSIVAGPAASLEVVAPTETSPGQPFWVQVRAKDLWGNPAASFRGTVRFDAPPGVSGLPASYTFIPEDSGFHRLEGVRVEKPGTYRIRGRDSRPSGLEATSNPVVALAESGMQPFWADLHGQTGESVGLGSVREYFAYARGFAAVDVAAHQANDFQVTRDAWSAISDASRRSNEAGRFVTFLGYEWSGTTGNGGDHNVVYLDDGQPLYHSSRAQIDEEDATGAVTDRYTVRDLAESLVGHRALLIPHVGGRRANLDFFDARLMPGIEVYSLHGQFEWFLEDALKRGLKVGFFAAGDDHVCKPGEAAVIGDRFSVRGGHTCIYAEQFTRDAIWDALRQRRFYATTGERIRLRFQSGAHWMGEELTAGGPLTFTADVAGTAGIERIDLFRGLQLVHRHAPAPRGPVTLVKVAWSGAESAGRARITTWDGGLHVSDGHIGASQPYRLDHPAERIEQRDERTVTWRSRTGGDEDGVLLQIDATPETVLTFESKPVGFSVRLGDLVAGERIFPAGGLRRQVVVSRVAADYPLETAFSWTETDVPPGTSAYWVRVQQQDGAVAWSSPIFVSRR